MQNIVQLEKLLQNINSSRALVNEYNKCKNTIDQIVDKRHRLISFIRLYPFAILIALVAFILALLASLFNHQLSNIFLVLSIGSLFYFILMLIFKNIIIDSIRNKTISDNKQAIEKLRYEATATVSKLHEVSCIPPKYWTIHALSSFEAYLRNLQADSLKECINLYEQQLQHMENINQLRIIQSNQAFLQASINNL